MGFSSLGKVTAMNAILSDRALLDLIEQVEDAANELDDVLLFDDLSKELRGVVNNATAVLSEACGYLLRLREQNHASESPDAGGMS
jgi:hypothetical protein